MQNAHGKIKREKLKAEAKWGNGEGGIHQRGIGNDFRKGKQCTQREDNDFSFDYTCTNLLVRE